MTTDSPTPPRRGIRTSWPVLVVAALFGVLYAYDLFEAASNLFGVTSQLAEYNAFAAENGLAERTVPWAVLITNLLLAPVGFIAALLIGRHRNVFLRALILAVGLSVTAAMSLSISVFA